MRYRGESMKDVSNRRVKRYSSPFTGNSPPRANKSSQLSLRKQAGTVESRASEGRVFGRSTILNILAANPSRVAAIWGQVHW